MRLVVIGGVAAGTKAASRARRMDPELEITIYQAEPEVSMSECGLPYFIGGVISERRRLVARTPDQFAEKEIQVLTRHSVENIDSESRKLTVRDLTTGTTFEDTYDRLIISTGAEAIVPPISGADLDGVFKLRFLTDADDILSYMDRQSPKKATIVGGGYIGLELAENLCALGLEVSLVEGADRVALAYGEDISEMVEDHLRDKGIKVYTGENVEGCSCEGTSEGCVKTVRFGDRELEADLVIFGIGVKPSVELAREAGVEIGETGAIKVDRRMKTNLPDVWAAGDCVETTNLASGKPVWVPLGDTANQMGRVAGTNAIVSDADGQLEFPGVLGTGIFKVFDLGVGKTGLSESEAEAAGFEPLSASVEAKDRAGYYPGVEKVFLKLVFDRSTGCILGAEAAGASVDKLIDVSATAIWSKLTYTDLVNMDLSYSPPYGPTLSPVIQAATIISGEFARRREGVRSTSKGGSS